MGSPKSRDYPHYPCAAPTGFGCPASETDVALPRTREGRLGQYRATKEVRTSTKECLPYAGKRRGARHRMRDDDSSKQEEGYPECPKAKAPRLRRLPESGRTQSEKPPFAVIGGRDICDFDPAWAEALPLEPRGARVGLATALALPVP